MATRNETYATRNELNSAPYDINSTRNETIPRLDYTDIWDKTNSANLQMNSRPFPYIYYIFRHTESPDLSNCIKSEAMDPPCSNWPPNTNMADELLYIHRRVVNTGTYNYAAARIPLPTKLNIEYLHRNLANYHDNEVVQFLKFGWPINYDKSTLPISKLGNHKGAREYPSHVDTFIKTEVDHRATIGPFTTNPFMFNTSISPLNTAPKRDPSERRVILDLSYPRGRSVNDGIPSNSYVDEQFRLSYPSVDSLCAMIRSKGRGCHIYKLDLTRAYRQLMVDPSDYPFLTYQWRGNFFADTVFPFGLRSASMACQRTTEALRYIHNSHGFPSIVFLDDLCGAETVDRSNDAFEDTQFVEIDSKKSSHQQIMCGVPQGSILGPLLYLLYVNDIHKACESSILSFADDTTLYISDHNLVSLFETANKEINKLFKWFCANKLSLNANKTKYIVIRPKHRRCDFDNMNVFINDTPLNRIGNNCIDTSIKFLGICIDEHLTWQNHIQQVNCKISKAMFAIKQVANLLHGSLLRNLYFALVHPHLNYGILSWGNAGQLLRKTIIL